MIVCFLTIILIDKMKCRKMIVPPKWNSVLIKILPSDILFLQYFRIQLLLHKYKIHILGWFWPWGISTAQKIKNLSVTLVTVHNIAKLCVIDGKNRKITKKLVQPVPPPPVLDPWEFQWENDPENKMAKNHFSGFQNDSQSV